MEGEPKPVGSLTGRELDILRLVALGLSNRDIAEELVVAPETVRWYTKQIYSKLGAHGRVPALVRAKKLGLLNDEAAHQPLTAASLSRPKDNLPVPMTPFIGRNHEITEVKHLLETARLLTLIGTGGTGKTRLALKVASEVTEHFADGVYFVDLAPVHDVQHVTNAVSTALSVNENPGEPLLNTLKRALAGRELLLLIDNFEHVIEAAPLVSELLAADARLKVLVTSREALRLSGEQQYPVPPLSLPSTETHSMQQETISEAEMLFVQRAQMIVPRFTLTPSNAAVVAQICTRLDGLPLAIELAAAQVKLLTPQAILNRLDSRLNTLRDGSRDAQPRQRTLRDTIDWSYNLLDMGERVLFARLAVFRGGRSLEAIEAICDKDLSISVFDGLASLMNKSLIHQKESSSGEPRFVMLETLHEYAWERLEESGEAETMRQQHAEYFVALAERAEPELRLSQQVRWLQLLELEHENLRSVLEWSSRGGDVTLGVRLAGALYMYWHIVGAPAESYHRTQQLLEWLDETPPIYHAKFLICAGYMAWSRNAEAASLLLTRAVDVSRKLGDLIHTAWALSYLSVVMLGKTSFAQAEEALALFVELDHKPGIAHAFNVLGELARLTEARDRAKTVYEECISLAEQLGDLRLLGAGLANRAMVAREEGDHRLAVDLLRRAVIAGRELNSRSGTALDMQLLAGSLAVISEPERAARLFGATEVMLERLGAFLEPHEQSTRESNLMAIRAQMDDAAFQSARTEGRAMTLEEAIAYALDE